jgi:hypothetical protein
MKATENHGFALIFGGFFFFHRMLCPAFCLFSGIISFASVIL